MPFFSRSPSESLRSSETGDSLSEAFLNTSSVRDTLPEQYRIHFDELRSGILAFCHEFNIPVETLRNKETFGKQLTSKKIPPERMAEAVVLFERLEYLIAHRKPLKETHPEYLEEAEHLYHLREQYASQVALLEQAGILEEGAVTGVNRKKYPIPTLEQVAQHLFERESELSVKRNQGFTKLLLVPFGMGLDDLCVALEYVLLTHKERHSDFKLDTHDPVKVQGDYPEAVLKDPSKIVYFPRFFSEDKHQGRTKFQILEDQERDSDSIPGWRVHLLQPSDPADPDSKGFASIFKKGQGKVYGEENPRADFEADKAPSDYLSILEKAKEDIISPYHGESGLTPEDWILAFMTHLQETGQPLDLIQGGGNFETCLIGSFFPSPTHWPSISHLYVPRMSWNHVFNRVDFASFASTGQIWNFGIHTSVII